MYLPRKPRPFCLRKRIGALPYDQIFIHKWRWPIRPTHNRFLFLVRADVTGFPTAAAAGYGTVSMTRFSSINGGDLHTYPPRSRSKQNSPLAAEGTRTHRSVYHALAVSPYAVARRQPNRCAEACVNAPRVLLCWQHGMLPQRDVTGRACRPAWVGTRCSAAPNHGGFHLRTEVQEEARA